MSEATTGNNAKMREAEDLSKHDEIIAEAREKYAVHHCGQCEFRKSCLNKFDSDECKNTRQSIMLGFGIEDGYFTKLLDKLEAAHKREREVGAEAAQICGEIGEMIGREQVTDCNHYNSAKLREALELASRVIHCAIVADILKGDDAQAALYACNAVLAAPPEPIGNNAKMREVLDEIRVAAMSDYVLDADYLIERCNAALAEPSRPCDTMNWRDAWEKWILEARPATPITYKECYESTVVFMDWYMSEEGGAE